MIIYKKINLVIIIFLYNIIITFMKNEEWDDGIKNNTSSNSIK